MQRGKVTARMKHDTMSNRSLMERHSRHLAGHPGAREAAVSRTCYESPARSLHCSSLSQPAAGPDQSTAYESRTLPRQRRRQGGLRNADPGSTRRSALSSTVADYLKSLNSMTRSIVLEREIVEEKHGGDWRVMDETLKEEVVNEHFMPLDVLAHYGGTPRRSPSSAVRARTRDPRYPSPSRQSELQARDAALLQKSGPQKSHPEHPSAPPTHHTSPAYFVTPTYNRLHKNQLSYRSKSLRKVMNVSSQQQQQQQQQQSLQLPQSQLQKRDSGLGSDGESPRMSDEDMHNSLGFHRNHLRSYSLKQRRNGSRNPNLVARSSTRRLHKLTGDVDSSHPSRHPTSEPTDNGYDAEVDLPDDALLLDHVPSQQHDTVATRSLPKPQRHSTRTRRSIRMQPRILVGEFTADEEEEKPEEATIIPNLHSKVSGQVNSSSSESTETGYGYPYVERPAIVLPNLRRVQSEESIDTDFETASLALSNISLLSKSTGLLTEDDIMSESTRLCPTPDSLLSVPGSITSIGSKSKGIIRSRPQSLRGGSSYQTSTSEFASRHAQFKPTILRKQQSNQNSPAVTRESSPAPPTPTGLDSRNGRYLPTSNSPSKFPSRLSLTKSPSPSYALLTTKLTAESPLADRLTSPNPLSHLSPPHTPEVKSLRSALKFHPHLCEPLQERRESGYISSSSESFAFPVRR